MTHITLLRLSAPQNVQIQRSDGPGWLTSNSPSPKASAKTFPSCLAFFHVCTSSSSAWGLGKCSLLKLALRTRGQGKSSNLVGDKQAACLFIFIIVWFPKCPLSEYTQDKPSAFARLQGSQVCPGPQGEGTQTSRIGRSLIHHPAQPSLLAVRTQRGEKSPREQW